MVFSFLFILGKGMPVIKPACYITFSNIYIIHTFIETVNYVNFLKNYTTQFFDGLTTFRFKIKRNE